MGKRHEPPQLDLFTQATQAKLPWADRVKLINATFPSTVRLDWKKLFDQDVGLLGDLVNDIIKADQAVPGRPGKRAAVDPKIAKARLRHMMGDDHSMDGFKVAFRDLTEGRSIRAVAAKTGLDRNMVFRLQRGDMEPDAYTMETIARAFGKEPGFFIEYRIGWIVGLLASRLEGHPEASVHLYRKLNGKK